MKYRHAIMATALAIVLNALSYIIVLVLTCVAAIFLHTIKLRAPDGAGVPLVEWLLSSATKDFAAVRDLWRAVKESKGGDQPQG